MVAKLTKTTTSSDHNDPLPRLDSTSLACCISGDTAAHNRPCLLVRHAFRDPRRISTVRKAVLLERSRHREAAVELLATLQFILTIGAELTLTAHRYHPLHASTVADFPEALDIWVHGYDLACSLVAGDAFG